MAIRTSTLVLIGAGGSAFFVADALPVAPAQRAAIKFGGLALAGFGVFWLLEDLRTTGGILGAVGGALVPIGPAREEVTGEITLPVSPTPYGLPTTEDARAASAALERAARAENVEGVALGGLSVALGGFIARPAEGSETTRSLFSSIVEVEIELENNSSERGSAFVELSAFFERLFGDDRRRSTVGTFELAPGERKRIKFDWDTGDRHTGLFETGAANVVLSLVVNGRTVANSEFRVL